MLRCAAAIMEQFEFSYAPQTRELGQRYAAQMRSDGFFALAAANVVDDLAGGASGDVDADAMELAVLTELHPDLTATILDAYLRLAGDAALAGLGAVGTIDPTGVADVAGAGVSLAMTRYGWTYGVDAVLLALSAIPFADILTKPALAVRWTARAEQLRALIASAKSARTLILARRSARSGLKLLDDFLGFLAGFRRELYPHRKLVQLKAYLARRGTGLAHGSEAAAFLDRWQDKTVDGLFVAWADGANTGSALVFRGRPTTLVVHHELWHRVDLLTNFDGDAGRGQGQSTRAGEEYVHRRLRKSRRWGKYPEADRKSQSDYIAAVRRGGDDEASTPEEAKRFVAALQELLAKQAAH